MASPAPPAPPCSLDASPTPPCSLDASPTVEAQATLPDHLTEEIRLRVLTAADLARASTAGPSLRRIVADHSFLRRFRTLHPPPPAPCSDFSCSFLPSRDRPWILHDFRDGRALLGVATDGRRLVREAAVCDPLHRRYLLLPPVPQDLSDLVYHWELFLAPAGGDEGADIAADAPFRFRVMCLAEHQTQLLLLVFSSSGPRAGQWHAVTFDGWSTLVIGTSDDARSSTAFGKRCYAHGCFCWAIHGIDKLLMLDIATMEFSSADLPPSPWSNRQMAFVEASQGRLGLFAVSHNHLLYSILGDIGDDPRLWHMGALVPLSLDYAYYIIGVAGGYLLLHGYPDNPESPFELPEPDCISLDLQTMKLELFCETGWIMPLKSQLLYAGFPPSLSPPTI